MACSFGEYLISILHYPEGICVCQLQPYSLWIHFVNQSLLGLADESQWLSFKYVFFLPNENLIMTNALGAVHISVLNS